MKNILKPIVFLICVLLSCHCNGQYRWEWGKSMHFTGTITPTSDGWTVATDHYGHVYAATNAISSAYSLTSVLFDTFRYTPPNSTTNWFIPIVKYDTAGKVIWVRNYLGLANITSMVTDSVGNLYFAGYLYMDSIVFGSTVIRDTDGTSWNFIVKLDSNGNCIWTKHIDNCGYYPNPSLATDNSGHLYLTSCFMGNRLIFGTDPLVNPHPGNDEILIMKMDTSGSVIWARHGGGSPTGYGALGSSVAVDLTGNVFITGALRDTAYFDTVRLTTTLPSTFLRIFVAKYDPNGTLLWVRSSGGVSHYTGTGTTFSWYTGDIGNGIITDNLGNAYLAANMSTYCLYFGTDTVYNYHEGVCDAVLAKLNSSGDVIWLKHFGGNYVDQSFTVAIDKSYQNVWLSGGFQSPIGYFGADTVYQTDSPAFNNSTFDGGFVARFDTAGNANLVFPLTYSGDDFNAIAIDDVGNVYFSGDYQVPSALGNDTFIVGCDTFAYMSSGGENFFVSKLAGPWVRPTDTTHNDTTHHLGQNNIKKDVDVIIYPNPATKELTIEGAKNCEVVFYDVTGRPILQTAIKLDKQLVDISRLSNEVYLVKVTDLVTGESVTKRLIKE